MDQTMNTNKACWYESLCVKLFGKAVCDDIESTGTLLAILLAALTGIILGLAATGGVIYLLIEIISHVWGF